MKTLHSKLIELDKTISIAESCSGGNIAHSITLNSGSSNYFLGGVVAYQNKVKMDLLQVSAVNIEKFGAVSEKVAIQMAIGIRKLLKSDYSVSTTGIAGPTGGSLDKPIGTVWIGISSKEKSFAKKFLFKGSREKIIELTTVNALRMVYLEICS